MKSLVDSTIALAGIFQAAELVRQIAYTGFVEQNAFENSMYSVLMLEANSTADVYNGVAGIQTGLKVLLRQLRGEAGRQREVELIQYVLSMIYLEKKLRKDKDMLKIIRDNIATIRYDQELNNLPLNDPQLMLVLAELYLKTISTLDYRIQVRGDQRYLENTENTEKIRALLFAGIRSVVLWRQKGGTRLQFLFSRKKIANTAEQLLSEVEDSL